MPRASIIVADSKDSSRNSLKKTLQRFGFYVKAEVRDVPEALRKCRSLFPDLLIVDSSLEGGSVLELADIVEEDNITSVLMLIGDKDNILLRDYIYILKPFTDETLVSVIEVCLHFKNRVEAMRKEIDKLRDDLSTRKLVEKAKGLLMKHLGLDEEQAYRKIQKESMNRGMRKKEIARAIIIAYEQE